MFSDALGVYGTNDVRDEEVIERTTSCDHGRHQVKTPLN